PVRETQVNLTWLERDSLQVPGNEPKASKKTRDHSIVLAMTGQAHLDVRLKAETADYLDECWGWACPHAARPWAASGTSVGWALAWAIDWAFVATPRLVVVDPKSEAFLFIV